MERMGDRSSKEHYAKGAQVRIVGGVYRRGSPVGTVVGTTRCYVDVNVPSLKREVRVHKTSVEQIDEKREEEKWGDVVKEEPLVGAALCTVCMVLVKCGVQEGNEELDKAVDMYLASAWRQKVRLAKDEVVVEWNRNR
jgi:hypothetical protein